MKLILCLIALGFSAQIAYGQYCYKRLCQNDVVMDEFGWGGTVDSFEAQNDLVIVNLSHNPGQYRFKYEDLGKHVRCFEGFCVGDGVIDKYGEEGRVYAPYDHGKIKVYDLLRDYIYIFDYKDITKAY